MKNNIILILVVTIVSIAIIVISVMVSVSGQQGIDSDSEDSVVSTVEVTAAATTPEPEPETTAAPTAEPTQEPETQESGTASDSAAENIIALARSLIGIDFADGGESPETGFDNSGFIYYVLRENGYITCPRGVTAQSEMGTYKAYDELLPGDLVFFAEGGQGASNAQFGGIYVGDGVMIACLMPGTQVREVDITTSYYVGNFYCGVRII